MVGSQAGATSDTSRAKKHSVEHAGAFLAPRGGGEGGAPQSQAQQPMHRGNEWAASMSKPAPSCQHALSTSVPPSCLSSCLASCLRTVWCNPYALLLYGHTPPHLACWVPGPHGSQLSQQGTQLALTHNHLGGGRHTTAHHSVDRKEWRRDVAQHNTREGVAHPQTHTITHHTQTSTQPP